MKFKYLHVASDYCVRAAHHQWFWQLAAQQNHLGRHNPRMPAYTPVIQIYPHGARTELQSLGSLMGDSSVQPSLRASGPENSQQLF